MPFRHLPSLCLGAKFSWPALVFEGIALVTVGLISTQGVSHLFSKPTAEPVAETPAAPQPPAPRPGIGVSYLSKPDLKVQVQALAGMIQGGRLEKVMPQLLGLILTEVADAKARGQSPEEFIAPAVRAAELKSPHADWVRSCVLLNWSVAHEFGLLTPENLERMRRGDAPRVTVGSYRGEVMETALEPVNDPHYKVAAAYPRLVPARLAKSLARPPG